MPSTHVHAIFMCIIFQLHIVWAQEKKIKLYAMYTPSHQVFLKKWFLPSIKDDYELILEFYDQTSHTGEFAKEGWRETMLLKVELIIRAIKENWHEIFIHSDVDIQFFAPTKDIILSLMNERDLVIQKDSPNGDMCAGFFACRGNKKNLEVWLEIKRRLSDENYLTIFPNTNDQIELNRLIKYNKKSKIKWKHFPSQFFSGGTLTGKSWKPGLELPLPENIILHHANWTVGIQNKIAQLEYVKSKMAYNPDHGTLIAKPLGYGVP